MNGASGWNLANVFETIADTIPERLAQAQGEREFTWRQFDRRADGIARALLDAGLTVTDEGAQDKVAQYLYNCPEYLESVFAAFKAGMATVNTNYRYGPDELVYLWDNADVVAVVFHGSFAATIEQIRARVPRVRLWLWVDDGSGPCPDWARAYEPRATAGESTGESTGESIRRVAGPWGRSGEHLLLLYTGGTTGMPKGVMWPQAAVFGALDGTTRDPYPDRPDYAMLADRIARSAARKPLPRNLPAAPLMHGTGTFNAVSNLILGGSVRTLLGRKFDPVELLDTIDRHEISSMSMVGDAFAKPILRALETWNAGDGPRRWDISSLRVVLSSGVMLSAESKAALLRHNPRLIIVDSLGSSEALSVATSIATGDLTAGGVDPRERAATAEFRLGKGARVIVDDGRGYRDVVPGSGEVGRVALTGHTPIGYYKDPGRTAATWVFVDGRRYSVPGDFAEVRADGTVKLLGRGSQCINTGGEKVYPEEVEECLKTHPAVADAAVVGLADERFGEAITALVELLPGAPFDPDALIGHVKRRLAGYKAPKTVHAVPAIGRTASGKLDYRAAKAIAASLASAG